MADHRLGEGTPPEHQPNASSVLAAKNNVDANYNAQFVRIDFTLLDNPRFVAFMANAAFPTYLLLRRYVWRGGQHPLGLDEYYHQKHLLASSLERSLLAKKLGLGDETRVSKHLKYLEHLGAIRRLRTGRATIVILGEWFVPPGHTAGREFYFIDSIFAAGTSDVALRATSEVQKPPDQSWLPEPHQMWLPEPRNNKERNRETTVNGDAANGDDSARVKQKDETNSPLVALDNLDLSDGEADAIADEITSVLGDSHSRDFYQLVARKIPYHLISETLSAFKLGGVDDPPKLFTYRMNELAKKAIAQRKGGIG